MGNVTDNPTIFISYAHSSDAHRQHVQELAVNLKDRGFRVVIDTDVQAQHPAGPEGGWTAWMEKQIQDCTWVLLVFDEEYRKRFDGEVTEGSGKGVAWEGRIVRTEIYEKYSKNSKFIPLLKDGGSREYLSTIFKDQTSWWFPSQTEELAEALRNPSSAEEPAFEANVKGISDHVFAVHPIGSGQYRTYLRSPGSGSQQTGGHHPFQKHDIGFLGPASRVAFTMEGSASLFDLVKEGTKGEVVGLPESKHSALGKYLFQQSAAKVPSLRNANGIHLRILLPETKAQFIWQSRLPWHCLYRNGVSLTGLTEGAADTGLHSTESWSVSLLCQRQHYSTVTFPAKPRILLVTPQPKGLGVTQCQIHVQELRREIRVSYPDHDDHDIITVVRTWDDFQARMKAEPYDVVYFYGIGRGGQDDFRLAFEDHKGVVHDISPEDFGEEIRLQVSRHPDRHVSLAFLNFCIGEPEGVLSAVYSLRSVSPCLVVNRTSVRQDLARRLGVGYFRRIFYSGWPPHEAAADIACETASMRDESPGLKWIDPLVYANYSKWEFEKNPSIEHIDIHPEWDLKLDRKEQMGTVGHRITELWDSTTARRSKTVNDSICFLWFGEEGQGMPHLHERIALEIGEAKRLLVLNPRWPEFQETHATDRRARNAAWTEKLLEAFGVSRTDELLPELKQAAKHQDCIVLSFPHIAREQIRFLNPRSIVEFLTCLDEVFLPILLEGKMRLLVLISFQAATGHVEEFRSKIDMDYASISLKNVKVEILRPLVAVDTLDISRFLTEVCGLRRDQIEGHKRKIERLCERTHGNYEKTVAELEDFVLRKRTLPELEDDQPRTAMETEY